MDPGCVDRFGHHNNQHQSSQFGSQRSGNNATQRIQQTANNIGNNRSQNNTQNQAKIVEYQAVLTIHKQDNNVIKSGINNEAMEYIYLGDNKDFRVGDIVEIIQAQESRDHRTEINAKKVADKNQFLNAPSSLFASSQSKVSPRIVKQSSSKQVPDFKQKEISTESSKHRTSLVVTLNQSFYKVNPQPKKFFVSIEQSLADLHGLRKDMAVTIRRIRPQDLESYHQTSGEEKPLVIQSLQKRKHELVADRVEVTVRDQFASRRDMWQLIQSLNHKTIYKGHQVDLDTVRFKVRNIFTTSKPQSTSPPWSSSHQHHSGTRKQHHYNRSSSLVVPANQSFHQASQRRETSQTSANKNNLKQKSEAYIEQTSAIVSTQHTRFTFFSKSCQVYCLIELSREMFDFDAQGFLQAEKMQIFVRNYLERCKADSSTHEIVFILYARLYYPQVGSITELLDLARRKSGRSNMTLPELESEGVFQFSKGKVFRDVYQKAGVVTLSLDTSNKTDYDKFLVELQRQIEKFPQIVDWQINCPSNLTKQRSSSDLVYFQQSLQQPRQNSALMIECELGDSERTNILEVINLALFNLNNEEVDMNLRTTGTQILILTAGMATYRVNKAIIAPTKSRILLGGIQIKLISFAREPPYRTPQLIDCCLYTNPFEKKKQSSKSQFQTPVKPRLTSESNFFNEERRDKTSCSDFQSKVLDWMQVTFLPHIKLLETHLSKEQRKKSTALLHLSKTPLLAPQFCKFQQAQMVTKVFNGVTKQNERLFEPHSMFVRSLSDIKNKMIAQTNKLNDTQEPTPTNSQTSRSSTHKKQKKFWRMDPNAYQLRQPSGRDRAYLLEQTGGLQPLFSDQIINEEMSSSKGGDGYQSDNISMNIMTTSPEKADAVGDQFIASSKEQAKQKLRKRMEEYDDKFHNTEKVVQQTKKLLSPFSSLNSSPVKSIIMPSYSDSQQFQQEKITNPKNYDQSETIFTSNILKPETKDNNIQADDPLFKQSATSNLILMNQSSAVQKQALKIGDKPQLRSYLRRWGHAVSICQLNFFNNQQVSSQSQQIEPADSKPYSTSFDQLPEHGGFDRTKNAYDLAVTQNYFDPLCKLMDSFWKQFSDVSLIPLTSQAYPNFEIKQHQSSWNNNPQSVQNQEIEDNLCLRLTQNFQFINERGCCFFPKAEGVRTKRYKMSIRDVYSMKTDAVQDQRWFEIKTYFKYKQSESELEETEAAFNYLLFNPHTDSLMPKRSQETRLFSVKKLWELDNVLEAFADHRESCIKLPAVCFVIYYDREKAREACNESESGSKQQLTYQQLMNKHVQEEQKEEEAFKYLCAKLEQNMGFFSLRGIQVVKQSQVDQNFILADSKAPQQPYANLYDDTTVQNVDSTESQKQRQQSEMLGEVSDFHDKKVPWSHDILESFIEQPVAQNNNLQISQAQRPGQGGLPTFGINGGQESSRQSIASSSFDQVNQSMQDPGRDDTFTYMPNQFPLSQSVAARAPSASVSYRKRDLDGRNNNPQSLKKKKQLYTLKKERSQQSSQDLACKNMRQSQPQKCENQYLLEHDSCYTTGACFHLKLQWIFCRGPDIQERIIKRLQRQVKEISKDCFKTLPLSEIIRRMQLNPFESNTILRDDYRIKEKALLEQREEEEKLEYMKKSFNAGPDFEMKIEMINSIDEEQIRSEGQAFKNTQTVIKDASKSEFERNRTKVTEESFLKLLGGVLTNKQTGYILDNKSKDEQKTYYLEKESGLCYVKHETSNRVTFSENDIVNNSHTDYLQSIKVRQKTQATLIALEVLVDMLYSATDGGELIQQK